MMLWWHNMSALNAGDEDLNYYNYNDTYLDLRLSWLVLILPTLILGRG
jgi:hypothetical protein